MLGNNKFLNKFERVTSSGLFMPEIDGLRFIAIILVVLFHSQSVINLNPNYIPLIKSEQFKLLEIIVGNGWQGVELFFTISGFILGLPFAKHHIQEKNKVNLKTYFLRRITRLEPPYIILMIIYFFMVILIDSGNVWLWFRHLLAHLTYTHNILMGNEQYLVSVAWSLEIEVQFYIFAPLLAFVFSLNKLLRRVLLISIIILFSSFHFYLPIETSTIYSFIHYFMIGFLLVDFYLENDKLKINKLFTITLGFLSLFVILVINCHSSLLNSLLFNFSIFVFYLLVLKTSFWKKIFSFRLITIIGGMCYTIYLIHTPILFFFRKFSHHFIISNEFIVNLILVNIVILPVILMVSAIYFYYIEKPCMKKYWYRDFLAYFRTSSI